MSSEEIYRGGEFTELRTVEVFKRHIEVPKRGIDCPVLGLDELLSATGVTSGMVQMDLLGDNEVSLPDFNPEDKTRLSDEYQKRAGQCADGSCPFIEEVETCWRRPENLRQDA